MNEMQLAQLKRQTEWHAQELRHMEHELQTAELAVEAGKKKVEELRKKVTDSKRHLDTMHQDVARATEENRRRIAKGERL